MDLPRFDGKIRAYRHPRPPSTPTRNAPRAFPARRRAALPGARGSVLQRISGEKARKSAEVPVRRPELGDAVRDAKRCNPCVVHHRALHPGVAKQLFQHAPVQVGLGEQFRDRGFEPGVYLIQRLGDRRSRVVDPRMGRDGQEFVYARPGKPPSSPAHLPTNRYGISPAHATPSRCGERRRECWYPPQSTSTTFVGGLTNACPVALAIRRLQAPAGHARIPHHEAFPIPVRAQRHAQPALDQRAKRDVLSRRVSLREPREVVGNLDGRLQYGSRLYPSRAPASTRGAACDSRASRAQLGDACAPSPGMASVLPQP